MNHSFVLEWNELDEDLRERKIDEYITYMFENGEYDDLEEIKELDDALENLHIRDNANYTIERYFPMYF